MAGPYGGLGPGGFVNSIYGPLQAQAAQQQQARVQTLNSLVGSILGALKAPSPDAYGAAAQDQTAAASAAANRLAASNPDAQTQAMLQAIGAPQSQQQQVSQHNQTVFGGGAALDQYMGGAVPAGVFAADQAAHQTYMNSLPALVGLAAQRGLGSLDLLASKENAQLGSEKATALQNAQSELAKYLQGNQSNRISQAAVIGNLIGGLPGSPAHPGLLGNTSPITTLAGSRLNLESAKAANSQSNADRNYNLAVRRLDVSSQPKANASLSKELGYVVDNTGSPILTNGQRVVVRGTKSAPYTNSQYAQALGLARIGHAPAHGEPGVSWQQYLNKGLSNKIPVAALIKAGRKMYSEREVRLGLIPGQGKDG